jgi:hypothetical protein
MEAAELSGHCRRLRGEAMNAFGDSRGILIYINENEQHQLITTLASTWPGMLHRVREEEGTRAGSSRGRALNSTSVGL